MKEAYLKHCDERESENLPPLALNAKQTKSVVECLLEGNDDDFYLNLLTHRVPPGVDEAAYVKGGFLTSVAKGDETCNAISKKKRPLKTWKGPEKGSRRTGHKVKLQTRLI